MGGEVLELIDDKVEHLSNKIECEREESIKQMKQIESSLAEQMAAYGIDQATIDQMMAKASAAAMSPSPQKREN
jgi:DNA-binding protein H-NS